MAGRRSKQVIEPYSLQRLSRDEAKRIEEKCDSIIATDRDVNPHSLNKAEKAAYILGVVLEVEYDPRLLGVRYLHEAIDVATWAFSAVLGGHPSWLLGDGGKRLAVEIDVYLRRAPLFVGDAIVYASLTDRERLDEWYTSLFERAIDWDASTFPFVQGQEWVGRYWGVDVPSDVARLWRDLDRLSRLHTGGSQGLIKSMGLSAPIDVILQRWGDVKHNLEHIQREGFQCRIC